MLPSPPSPLPQQSSPEEAPGRGTPALVHPERGMRQDSRHTQRGKLAVRTTHTGRRHSPGRTCGHVRRWICCYSQHTRAHMLTQACAQRERPQPSSSLPPPRPSAQAHRPTQTDAYGATRTHTQTCTHIPAAHPPSASGGGSFAAHMEHRSSWAVLESGCGVGLGHLSQGIVHQPLYAPHPARTVTTPHGEVLPPTP